jgi:nicotinamide mononucleotide (NMN) deamidase PncC
LVYFGLSGPDGTHVLEQRFGGNRERNRERSATLALEMVRRRLMKSP